MDTQTDLQVPAQVKQRKVFLFMLSLIGLGLAGMIATMLIHNRCYSVGEVWKYALILNGSRICVKGKADTLVYQTLLLCDPPSCDCNKSGASLTLVSDDKIVRNPRVSMVDTITIFEPVCTGNECSLTCTPIDPFAADDYRFVGRLTTSYLSDGRMAHLELANVDLSASRQMVNGDWQPLPIGKFTRPTH